MGPKPLPIWLGNILAQVVMPSCLITVQSRGFAVSCCVAPDGRQECCHIQVLLRLGPKGLEFGRYSIDYHFIRNWLYVKRKWSDNRAEEHIPKYAKRLVAMYDQNKEVSDR